MVLREYTIISLNLLTSQSLLKWKSNIYCCYVFINSYQCSILVHFGLFQSTSIHLVYFGLFPSILIQFVLFGPVWSILVIFDTIRSNLVQIGPIRSTLKYSVHLSLIRSILVQSKNEKFKTLKFQFFFFFRTKSFSCTKKNQKNKINNNNIQKNMDHFQKKKINKKH